MTKKIRRMTREEQFALRGKGPVPPEHPETFRLQFDGRSGGHVEMLSEWGGAAFDELALGDPCWLHLERLHKRGWFLSIGNRAFWIRVDRKGKATITMEETR